MTSKRPTDVPLAPRIMLGEASRAQALAQALNERRFFFTVVPKGQARIRTNGGGADRGAQDPL